MARVAGVAGPPLRRGCGRRRWAVAITGTRSDGQRFVLQVGVDPRSPLVNAEGWDAARGAILCGMEVVRRWLRKWWRSARPRDRAEDPRRLGYVRAMNTQVKLSLFAVAMLTASLTGWAFGLSAEQALLGGGGAVAAAGLHWLAVVVPARRRVRRLGVDPDEV